MKISELILRLQELRALEGDLPVYALADWQWEITNIDVEFAGETGWSNETAPKRILLS